MTVAFDVEGTIRVPHGYLAAGRLEHGYARTSYGVQGATHGTARYHPTDVSGFEEGYVAITRGRDANRLYVVDGTIGHADDETHQTPDPQRFDLDDIAAALARRRTGAMAADSADRLAIVHHLATTRTLGQIAAERQPLEAILATAPPDTTAVIGAVTKDLDALLARRNLWADAATDTQRVEHLDRSIGSTQRRLAAAERQQASRDRWMDDHIDVVDRADLLRRAGHDRRARIVVNPQHYLPTEAVERDAAEPALQRDRLRWRSQLAQQAIDADLASTEAAPSEPSVGMEVS